MMKTEEKMQLLLAAGVHPGVQMCVYFQLWVAPSIGVRMRESSLEPDSLPSE